MGIIWIPYVSKIPNVMNNVHPVIRKMIMGWNFCLMAINVASMANTGFMPVGTRDRKMSSSAVAIQSGCLYFSISSIAASA